MLRKNEAAQRLMRDIAKVEGVLFVILLQRYPSVFTTDFLFQPSINPHKRCGKNALVYPLH